jgi:carbamoyl-phosphate synthase large subunit
MDHKRPTVLVTGAGGAAVPGLIEHLQGAGYRVLAADMDPSAPGLLFGDAGYVIPGGKSPAFPRAILRLCREQGVDVFVPLVDEELLPSLDLEAEGVRVVLPRREFVRLCLDKFALMEALAKYDLGAPRTRLLAEDVFDFGFPLVVKPRTGRGSRDVTIVQNSAQLDALRNNPAVVPDRFIVQEFIDGTEYTVSVVTWRDGEVQAVVPKRIIEKRGITRLAVTERHAAIETLCRRVQERLRGDAPFNVQLRLTGDGEPRIFEINPRFSTTVSLTMAAGVDEFGGVIAQALDRGAPKLRDEWRAGLVLVRRSADVFWNQELYSQRQPVKAALPAG